MTEYGIDRHFSLLSIRPNDSTPDGSSREELPIRRADKSKEDIEHHKPAGARFAARTPKKQDGWGRAKSSNWDPSQVSGSGITTASKKYSKYLRVPPNSPDGGSTEMTPKGKTSVDATPKEDFKRPYTTQMTKETNRTDNDDDATVPKENIDHRATHQMPKEINQTESRFEDLVMQMRLSKCNPPESDDSGSETEKEDSAAKRAAARKRRETAKEHVITQGKNKNDKDEQDPPTKEDLGKKVRPKGINSS
ncbi:hypothetical protein N7471_000351 [Penicillium samsonianum]|uniref:uncharacterized protein n=1 Tax=Penicillium samsonianum TaxID=1882272 RepID=UPI00254686F0|nr:uncharacterized protein N7471_000351 [Penicillium samsonianum]KAJ6149152.1 hypothetical protein N7471_000351 [Penicillium samsonianum]